MTTTRRRVGIAGAVVGVTSAGVAAAALAKRYAVGRIRLRPDPEASEPLGELRGRRVTITTSDGVELHAEADGPEEAPLTVVFCHGYTLNLDSWHYQRRDLRDYHRLVLWDQRCHGLSQRCAAEDSTIDRLGEDLFEVLEKLVPGPCVLVGHSMGGMTIMALADRHPELFGDRIKGVALIATSAGKLAEVSSACRRCCPRRCTRSRRARCRCSAAGARWWTGAVMRPVTSPSWSCATSASATPRTSAPRWWTSSSR
nr:hypothetical protein GCM10020093_088310 [Planobispora longispora]